ncbi:MAG TPA: hypothetical protein VG432_08015 [Gemmatimonadaceae bacterium]|nr:hypothetical protein [Gemmatimonadaceae bacterium]
MKRASESSHTAMTSHHLNNATADLTPPTESPGERTRALAKHAAKGALGAVPLAGGALAEVVDVLFRDPLEARRERWFEQVAEAIEDLRARKPNVDVDGLARNEEFVTTLHHATDAAMRTHHQEKLSALRNAVLNAALPGAPDSDMQIVFVQLVQQLSPTHLRILAVYNDPLQWFAQHGITPPTLYAGSRAEVLQLALPDIARANWRVYAKQLEDAGLMGSLAGMVTGPTITSSATTDLGKEFLAFISAPDAA